MKKVEGEQTTFYLRSTVLGGQVVAEYNQSGEWRRGYVYDGTGHLLAMQAGEVQWVHSDPVTKSKRVTNRQGEFVAAIDVDPWGGETARMANGGALSRRYTTYERDGNGRDQAMMRSYSAWFSRFDQPDPYDGSYDLANPQTFNRYAYVGNDPVNFVDPSGMQDGQDPYSGDVPPPGGHPPPDPHPVQVYSELWLSRDIYLSGGRLGGGLRPRLYRLESPQNPTPTPTPQQKPLHCEPDIIKAMEKAWMRSGIGTRDTEAGFLAIRNANGTLGTVNLPNTNQHKTISAKVTIPAGATVLAVFHTHPTSGGASPSTGEGKDTDLSEKKGYPYYVMTGRGLQVYNPTNSKMPSLPTGKTTVLANNLDEWLKGKGCPK